MKENRDEPDGEEELERQELETENTIEEMMSEVTKTFCSSAPSNMQNTVESRFLEPSVSLGFASLKLYNFTPVFLKPSISRNSR